MDDKSQVKKKKFQKIVNLKFKETFLLMNWSSHNSLATTDCHAITVKDWEDMRSSCCTICCFQEFEVQ